MRISLWMNEVVKISNNSFSFRNKVWNGNLTPAKARDHLRVIMYFQERDELEEEDVISVNRVTM